MTLTQITKVKGPGIHTLANIVSNTISLGGIATASNFKTGTSNLHNVGVEVAGINVLGADTPIGTGATIYDAGGAVFTGVVTATKFVGQADISGGSIVGTSATFTGNVSIGGTLTYEDVTNIDSVGLVTARNGLKVLAGGADIIGQTTIAHTASPQLIIKDSDTSGTGDSNGISLQDSGGTQYGFIGASGTGDHSLHLSTTNTVNPVRIQVNGTTRIEAGNSGAYVTGVFDVTGNSSLRGVTHIIKGTSGGATSNTDSSLILDNSSHTYITFRTPDNKEQGLLFGDDADNDAGGITYVHSTNHLGFRVNADERARIDSSGRVLVGTTVSPSSANTLLRVHTPISSSSVNSIEISHNTNGADKAGAALGLAIGNGGESTNAADLYFSTATNGSLVQILKITSGGNLYHIGGGNGRRYSFASDGSSHYMKMDTTLNGIILNGYGGIAFETNGTNERVRIDSNGYLLAGHDTRDANLAHGTAGRAQFWGTSWANAGIALVNTQASTDPAFLTFAKSRKANADASAAVVQSGDRLGEIRFAGDDGTDMHSFGASIAAYAQGTIAGNRMPGKLVFATTSDTAGAVSSSTRLVIDASGHITPGDAGTQDLGSTAKEWGNIYVADDKRFYAGSDQNVSLYHNNTTGINYLTGHPGNMWYQSATHYFTNAAQSQVYAQFIQGSYCELRYAGNIKLQTSTTGIDVTGEVASSQDYPDFRPALDLNFAAVKKLDSRITYYRSGPASYVDEYGKVVFIGDNTPRFDHHPVTRECKGLLIEDARTNYLEDSDLINNWTLSGNDTFTESSGAQLSTNPDGSSPAYKYTPASGAYHHRYYKSFTVPTYDTSYVASVFVKRVTAGSVSDFNRYMEIECSGSFASNTAPTGHSGSHGMSNVTFDLQNLTSQYAGNTAVKANGLVGDPKIEDYGNGWYRCSYVFNPGTNDGSASLTGHIWFGHPATMASDVGNENPNGNPSFYFWGAMVEKGSSISSYIPNHGAWQSDRGADYAVIDGQEFTDFYNTQESSVFVVGNLNRPAWTQGQLNILHIGDSNSDGHGIFREHGGKDVWYHIRSGGNTASSGNFNPSGFGDWNSGQDVKIALAFKSGDQGISVNGGNQITGTVSSGYPSSNISKMWIGSHGSGSFFEGTIKRIAYYSKYLPDSQLNTLTA